MKEATGFNDGGSRFKLPSPGWLILHQLNIWKPRFSVAAVAWLEDYHCIVSEQYLSLLIVIQTWFTPCEYINISEEKLQHHKKNYYSLKTVTSNEID